jgi:hypothetical protein
LKSKRLEDMRDFSIGNFKFRYGQIPKELLRKWEIDNRFYLWLWNSYYWEVLKESSCDFDPHEVASSYANERQNSN